MKLSMWLSSAWWLSPPKNCVTSTTRNHCSAHLGPHHSSIPFGTSVWTKALSCLYVENLEQCMPLYPVSSLGPPGWGGNENKGLLNASPARKRPPQNCWTKLRAFWGEV